MPRRRAAPRDTQGVAHRDLSLENVVLTRHGSGLSLRLIDFGMATLQREVRNEALGVVPGVGVDHSNLVWVRGWGVWRSGCPHRGSTQHRHRGHVLLWPAGPEVVEKASRSRTSLPRQRRRAAQLLHLVVAACCHNCIPKPTEQACPSAARARIKSTRRSSVAGALLAGGRRCRQRPAPPPSAEREGRARSPNPLAVSLRGVLPGGRRGRARPGRSSPALVADGPPPPSRLAHVAFHTHWARSARRSPRRSPSPGRDADSPRIDRIRAEFDRKWVAASA